MKLIDEKEADKAAYEFAEVNTYSRDKKAFKEGVDFAEQKILPMFQEYADWWNDNVRMAELPNHFCIKGQWTMCYKKEQLFEQFIKTRKK